MLSIKKYADPTFSTKVSPEEQAAAKELRKLFQEFNKKQDVLEKYLSTFFDNLKLVQDPSNIVKISPILKLYTIEYRKVFNKYIASLEKAIQYAATNFKDSDMNNIRDLVVESVKDIRNNSIEMLDFFNNVSEQDFVKNIQGSYDKIKARLERVQETVSDELFGHIDYNILGKIRLSFNQIPLSIKSGS